MTAPVRADQDAELREAVARFWWDRVCPAAWIGRWDDARRLSGFRDLLDETYEDAEAIIAGPLATLRAERDQLAAELDSAALARDQAGYLGTVADCIRHLNEDNIQLASELREAREALKPFAEAADNLEDRERDSAHLWESPEAMMLTAGNLRAARAALTPDPHQAAGSASGKEETDADRR